MTRTGRDLAEAVRRYTPRGATMPPAAFAKDGANLWTLAKLAVGPIPAADFRSLEALLYGKESIL
jgi:hypothetical protein